VEFKHEVEKHLTGKDTEPYALVQVKAVRYESNRAKTFYRVDFNVLEPTQSAGKIISGRLYCTDYKKGAPFEVGCGCCHEQSTTPDERNTQWTV